MQRRWIRLIVATLTVALGAVGLAASGDAIADAASVVRAVSPEATSVDALAGLVTNGPIYDIERIGDTTYVGGDFDYVGERTGPYAGIATTSAETEVRFPAIPTSVPAQTYQISDLEPDGEGGWFVAGYPNLWSDEGGSVAVARLSATGDVVWAVHGSGVSNVKLSGGVLLVMGSFTSLAGETRNRIAAVNPVTGTVLPWSSALAIPSGVVPSATLANGVVFLSIAHPFGPSELRAINYPSGTVRQFNPSVSRPAKTIEYFDGLVVTDAGTFDETGLPVDPVCGFADPNQSVEGERIGNTLYAMSGTTEFIACDLSTGSVDLRVATGQLIRGISVGDGKVFVSVGSNVDAYDATTGQRDPWSVATNGSGGPIAVSGSTIAVSSYQASSVNVQSRSNLAAIDASGNLTGWAPTTNGTVRALDLLSGSILTAGDFTQVGGVTRNALANIDASTGSVGSWDPDANGSVLAVEVDTNTDTVFVGGRFTTIGGQPRTRLAAIDPSGDPVPGWTADASGTVTALGVAQGDLYVGGVFSTLDGAPRRRLGAVGGADGSLRPWDPGADDYTRSFAVVDDMVYLAGAFQEVAGQPRARLAAVDRTSGELSAWDPSADGEAWAIAPSGETFYLGGSFGSVQAAPHQGIAAAGADGVVAEWNPLVTGAVYALSVSDGRVTAAGTLASQVTGLRSTSQARTAVPAASPADATMLSLEQYTVSDLADPVVGITTPADGVSVARGATLLAAYTCADEVGGSGIAACDGPVANGAPVDTAVVGAHEFTVVGSDRAGNSASVTHHYTVVETTDPTVTLATPPDGAVYERNQTVLADYTCSDEVGGSGVASCIGDVADGQPIDTSTVGVHDFAVDAADNAGNTVSVTHHYTVLDGTDPTVRLGTPPEGAVYRRGESIAADYSCADEVGGSGLSSCVGDVADGQPIDTSTVGVHDFTVDAADAAGNTASVTHQYTVADAQPDAAIRTGAGAYVGDDVYNTTGRGQKASGSAARGRTVTYTVQLQNDAPFADSVHLRGTGSAGQYGVTYWLGQTDVTSQVIAGTFTTATIPASQSVTVKVKVKVKTGAAAGSSLTGKLTSTSSADGSRQDAVKFTARRV